MKHNSCKSSSDAAMELPYIYMYQMIPDVYLPCSVMVMLTAPVEVMPLQAEDMLTPSW